MAQIVDTNIASVKMTGAFSAIDLMSSEEETEESEHAIFVDDKFCRRPRSNATVSETTLPDFLNKQISDSPEHDMVHQKEYFGNKLVPVAHGKRNHQRYPLEESDHFETRRINATNRGLESNVDALPSQTHSDKGTLKQGMTESIIRAMSCSSGSSMQELYYQSRFNPFDRDFHLEEDHFSDNPESNLFDRKNSSPTSISSCLDSGDIINNDHEYSQESDEGQVTFAELGLAEDHFSHPEGHFGLSKTEELELAISNCKELIIAAPTNSDRQKNLVSKLIQLRIKLQEIKEGPAPVEPDMLIVMGHVFKKKTSHSSKYYCEKCNKVIWGMLQEWHRCIECGYRCHDKCVQLITRTCAIVKVKENPAFIYDLCPRNPKGLAAQDFRCAECRMHISGSDGMEARLCEYNGRYYCEMCHWNDLMYIPAQILHNWDFEKRKVCRASKQFLKLMRTKPVIRVQDVNPMLFNYVEQLRDIKHLREELLIMKKYILACPAAMAAKLLLQLSSWPHFVECSDRYSVQDLLDSDDSLIPDLVQVHSSWAQHIKTECQVCQGRGFVCELCSEKEVLFPFDNTAVVCCSCSNVMHRICFAQKGVCQRCERRKKRQQDHVETL